MINIVIIIQVMWGDRRLLMASSRDAWLWEGWLVAIPLFKVLQFDILAKFWGNSGESLAKLAKTQETHKSHNSAFRQGWEKRSPACQNSYLQRSILPCRHMPLLMQLWLMMPDAKQIGQVKIEDGKITDAKFKTFGCGSATPSGPNHHS